MGASLLYESRKWKIDLHTESVLQQLNEFAAKNKFNFYNQFTDR